MSNSPSRPIRLEIILVILTVMLSGTVSWIVSFYQAASSKYDKRLDSKIACFDRVVKNFAEYPDASMIYFLDYIADVRGEATSDSDGKHIRFHNQFAELRTCMELIPLLFGAQAKQKAEELTTYLLDNPWEQIVQSSPFADEARRIGDSGSNIDSVTTLITLKTEYESYLSLTRDLTKLMAEEIAPGHSNSVQQYPSTNGYCTVSPEQAKVGEIVTFAAFGKGGNGYFTYTWSGDENLTSFYRTVSMQYSTLGEKTASVRITSNGQNVYRQCIVKIVP